jgi:hypothetical protein
MRYSSKRVEGLFSGRAFLRSSARMHPSERGEDWEEKVYFPHRSSSRYVRSASTGDMGYLPMSWGITF